MMRKTNSSQIKMVEQLKNVKFQYKEQLNKG